MNDEKFDSNEMENSIDGKKEIDSIIDLSKNGPIKNDSIENNNIVEDQLNEKQLLALEKVLNGESILIAGAAGILI